MEKIDMLRKRFDELRAKRSESLSLAREISQYVGIAVDETYFDSTPTDGQAVDVDVDDPTAAMAVIQAGDYLAGILWGNGNEALTLEPSDWIESRIDKDLIKPYYDFRTKQLLRNMNHYNAGFGRVLKAYLYDQMSFGTSGIGVFVNEAFRQGKEDNPYIFRNFGIDNTAIDEGINGAIDTIFVIYRWRVTRIMQEFEMIKDRIPQCIKDDYESGNLDKTYALINAIVPKDDYNPDKKGIAGAKYESSWFLSDNKSEIFYEEYFRERPISMCRAIKIRGQVMGRGFGTMLISSIKMNNYLMQQAVENIVKKNKPSLGTWGNSVMGDSVIDMSAGELNTFNPEYAQGGQPPLWKLYEEGDPSALIQFLIPFFNEKITSGFKIDVLLDFNAQRGMTATESIQRYTIRNKSLAGLTAQQTDETLIPTVVRCLQIEDDLKLYGLNPKLNQTEIQKARDAGREDIVIPDVVLEAMETGKRWYKIKFNGEIDRMSRTQNIERIMNFGNGVGMLAQFKPQVLSAVNEYDIVDDLNNSLGTNYIKSKQKYEEDIDAMNAQAQQQATLEQGKQASEMIRNVKGADLEKMVSQ